MNPVKTLLTYRYSEIIHDLTVEFTRKYVDYKSRTRDQMDQAARSGKQNIVEGVAQSQTSKKGEIKLLGVAKASFEELTSDYEDHLRQHGLEIFPRGHPKVSRFQSIAYRLSDPGNLSDLGSLKEKPALLGNQLDDANFLLTLCHIETYLLYKQIVAAESKFVTEGGYTENLFHKRLKHLK